MKLYSLLAYYMLFQVFNLTAQQWSDPVNISNNGLSDVYHDFIIDNDGNLHCVWKRIIESNYSKLYYSQSQNHGDTWSPPQNISLNSQYSLANAHIINDSDNNLYVTYDYNIGDYFNTEIHLKKYDGVSWSDETVVSEGYPGSDNNNLVIDCDDRLYCFWDLGGMLTYRYFENNVWSDIVCLYDTIQDIYPKKIVADPNGILHFAALRRLQGQSSWDLRVSYFTYNKQNNLWSDLQIVSNKYVWHGTDMDLDNELHPHITWCQLVWDSISLPPPYGTFYSYYNGSEWVNDSVVVMNTEYPSITVIDNKPLIFAAENKESEDILHVFSKDYLANWYLVDTLNFEVIRKSIPKANDNILYLTFDGWIETNASEIYFMKANLDSLITGNTETHFNFRPDKPIVTVFPNPFYDNINISITLNEKTSIRIDLMDVSGYKTGCLLDKQLNKGTYELSYHPDPELAKGIYFLIIQIDSLKIVKKILKF